MPSRPSRTLSVVWWSMRIFRRMASRLWRGCKTMAKFISDMTEADLTAASPEQIAKGLTFRIQCSTAQLWNDLDVLNDRVPGFGEGCRTIIADALDSLAREFRSGGLPHWRKAG